MNSNNFNEKNVCKSCRENTPGGRGNLKIGGTRYHPLDKKEMYNIGASLKDLGKKLFAFSRMDAETKRMLEVIGV